MSYVLGIDIGSSKVAAVIVDSESGQTKEAVSILHSADTSSEILCSEQDPSKLLETVGAAVNGLSFELRQQVSAAGVCGQMHGVVLWKDANQGSSQLITWQDKRASEGAFLSVLRKTSGQENIHAGYGMVTLAWLQKYRGDWLTGFSRTGTIMDFLVTRMCGHDAPVIDCTNAASWGFYDGESQDWNYAAVDAMDIPRTILPEIVETGTKAGNLNDTVALAWQVPVGIPVCVACGDSPAAVYATRELLASGCFLNLGTGGQLGVVVPAGSMADYGDLPGLDVRPFPGHRELVVTTSLCGGKAFVWLVDVVEQWLAELGIEEIPRDALFDRLTALGAARQDVSLPVFLPYFVEERHAPGLLGSISGIAEDNFSLGAVTRSLVTGMIAPLFDRMPAHLLEGKTRVVGTGNGIRRSKLVQDIAGKVSGMELVIPEVIEAAASGSARLAGDSLLG